MQRKSILISIALVGCALIVGFAALQARAQSAVTEAAPQPLALQSVIGNGTPGSCTEAAFATAFTTGGNLTFNCGAAPVTITLTSRYTVTVDTLIDGGTLEQITLSGGDTGSGPRNGIGLFAVPAGRSLTLQNMALTHTGDTAIVNAGTLHLVSSRIDYARAAMCGGIDSVGDLMTNLSLIAYSTVDGVGGGVCIRGGTAELLNSQIYGNAAGGADRGGCATSTASRARSHLRDQREIRSNGRGRVPELRGQHRTWRKVLCRMRPTHQAREVLFALRHEDGGRSQILPRMRSEAELK